MKFLFKIILFLSLFSVALSANLPKIDECKSDLYYANGILIQNSKFEAEKIWEEKAVKLLADSQELRKNIYSYKVAYNHSYSTISDLFEAFIQKTEAESGYKVTWEAFKLFVGLKLKKADDLLSLAENVNNSVESHDLTNHINAYKDSIKSGHGVIVISHSQGNLFTNRAYGKLDEWMKPYFHNMGVATPAHEVASGGPYVTFDNDPIHYVPNALDDNLHNENRYYSHTNALGEQVEALTGAFHAFDYYLGSPAVINNVSVSSNQASEKIKIFIIESIQAHAEAPSQWVVNQAFEKNTENYKITVKHLYDPEVSIGVTKVYPFNKDKKLYHINDGNITGYVKASCGGEEILDQWDDKKENEAYLINNPQKEKISYGIVIPDAETFMLNEYATASYDSYEQNYSMHVFGISCDYVHKTVTNKWDEIYYEYAGTCGAGMSEIVSLVSQYSPPIPPKKIEIVYVKTYKKLDGTIGYNFVGPDDYHYRVLRINTYELVVTNQFDLAYYSGHCSASIRHQLKLTRTYEPL